jgi:hypothetical protein
MMRLAYLVLVLGLAAVAGCQTASSSTATAPVRIGFFVGVDAITYSVDGSKFHLYEKYVDRELMMQVPSEELARLVARLTDAGMLAERTPELYAAPIPPLTYELWIKWPDHDFHCRWYHSHNCVGGCHVPSKYLDILDNVPTSWRTDILRIFTDQNRELINEEKTQNQN